MKVRSRGHPRRVSVVVGREAVRACFDNCRVMPTVQRRTRVGRAVSWFRSVVQAILHPK